MKQDELYNPEKLLREYEPLIKSVSKKFNNYFKNYEDKLDLYSQIQYEFIKLVQEYNPKRGIDFPYYIKRMLNQRTYHYVTKQLKVVNSETCVEELADFIEAKDYFEDDVELFEGLMSLDDNMVLGKKQRELLEKVLIEKKTMHQIAEEEGVDIKVIRLRLHFLCKKLIEHNNELEDYYKFMEKSKEQE